MKKIIALFFTICICLSSYIQAQSMTISKTDSIILIIQQKEKSEQIRIITALEKLKTSTKVSAAVRNLIKEILLQWNTKYSTTGDIQTGVIQTGIIQTGIIQTGVYSTGTVYQTIVFYTSSHHTSKQYYCSTDSARESLSKKYLEVYASEKDLLTKYPSKTLNKPCF